MIALLAPTLTAPLPTLAAALPKDFVRLADIDPSIRQSMRYAGADNFLERKIKGYDAPVCILTREAAEALSGVQKKLAPKDLTLVVFDCYRPASAASDMVAWTLRGGAPNPRWNPKVRRDSLVLEGYVGEKSSHSRGSTVDVAIARMDGNDEAQPSCGAAEPGMLDFGAGFDCFDPVSETAAPSLSNTAAANRDMLLRAMKAGGFKNYSREWWHFTLEHEPFPTKRFDFPVTEN